VSESPVPDQVWQEALEKLRARLPKTTFDSFFRHTQACALDHHTLMVTVPNQFARDWLERNAARKVKPVLVEILGEGVGLRFVVNQLPLPMETSPAPPPSRARACSGAQEGDDSFTTTPLNPRYTFASFVVGQSNRLAKAAAQAVANRLGDCYNPLFIYGGSGLGKTHLMQAIGHEALAKRPELSIAYVSGDVFTYHVVSSIREDRFSAFRRRYRNVDVWLVDDIQFIAAKERTEQEFFQAFNALYETNKQIVITSDQAPKNLQIMDDRLLSRFESGLIVDIKPPDLETRLAILAQKAEAAQVEVPEQVAAYVAEVGRKNVRVLEGMLNKLIAASSLTGEPITLAMAIELLKDHSVGDRTRPITVAMLKEMVAAHFHLSLDELTARKRTRDLVLARQIAMYLARELLKCSFPEIARQFGGKDHTTVIHACRKVSEAMAKDPSIKGLVDDLTEKLGAAEA